jgi:3-hydroxyacyl-[acyl-carrier-protein] dehydratase
MLLNNFYTIVQHRQALDGIEASIAINKDHSIFDGHFPGLPVVPGVCMIQIIKEITSLVLGHQFMLQEADHVKFLNVINPLEHGHIEVSIKWDPQGPDEHFKKISATLFAGSVTFFKLKAIFQQR